MKKIMATFLGAFVASAGLLAVPSPAQAADGWIYAVVNDRVCGSSGVKARGILANVQPTG